MTAIILPSYKLPMNFLNKRLTLILFSLLVTGMFSACKKEGCTDPAALNYDALAQRDCCCEYASTGTLSFDVLSRFGSSPFELARSYYHDDGTPFRLNFTAFYFSGFTLLSDTGEMLLKDRFIYFRGDSSTFRLQNVPSGQYTGLRFLIGIDSLNNYSKLPAQFPADQPLGPKTPLMHWSWNTGYIFLRFDGEVDTSIVADGIMDDALSFHIGTNKCLTPVTFNKNFIIKESGQSTLNLIIDYQRFFEGINLRQEHVTHTSDYPDLTDKFRPNIGKAFSIQ
jgi:hypothetical protein